MFFLLSNLFFCRPEQFSQTLKIKEIYHCQENVSPLIIVRYFSCYSLRIRYQNDSSVTSPSELSGSFFQTLGVQPLTLSWTYFIPNQEARYAG